jgi:hypothetical protein
MNLCVELPLAAASCRACPFLSTPYPGRLRIQLCGAGTSSWSHERHGSPARLSSGDHGPADSGSAARSFVPAHDATGRHDAVGAVGCRWFPWHSNVMPSRRVQRSVACIACSEASKIPEISAPGLQNLKPIACPRSLRAGSTSRRLGVFRRQGSTPRRSQAALRACDSGRSSERACAACRASSRETGATRRRSLRARVTATPIISKIVSAPTATKKTSCVADVPGTRRSVCQRAWAQPAPARQ